MDFNRRDERVRVTETLHRRPQLLPIQIGTPRTAHQNEVVLVAPASPTKHIPGDGRCKRWKYQVLEDMPGIQVIDKRVVAQLRHDFVLQTAEFANLLLI